MSIFIAPDWLDFFIAYLCLTNNKQPKFLVIYSKKGFKKVTTKIER